jgi:hypothetical protein
MDVKQNIGKNGLKFSDNKQKAHGIIVLNDFFYTSLFLIEQTREKTSYFII